MFNERGERARNIVTRVRTTTSLDLNAIYREHITSGVAAGGWPSHPPPEPLSVGEELLVIKMI